MSRPCPKCYGRGTIINKICPHCAGSGVEKHNKTYTVKIPPGAHTGQKLLLKGQGAPIPGGRGAGNLVVILKVRKHHFFDVRGSNVYCEVPLDKKHAKAGTKIRVKTIEGKKVEVKIPPGTKDGDIFKLQGLGVPVNGKKGCQFVRINIQKK